jgi:tRNA/rRNA methyltransferase/tRNA (cytidine32/uridine32-2'-O)-methyltransferase
MGRPEEWSEETRWVPIGALDLDKTAKTVADCLESVGFYKQAGRPEQERLFRDIFARAGITLDESRYLEAVFRKMARLASGK